MVPESGNIEHESDGTGEESGAHQDDEDQNPGMENIAWNRQDAEEIEGITSENLRSEMRESVISGVAKTPRNREDINMMCREPRWSDGGTPPR
mmetsp:Transcript_9176/g.32499  ORF Transcript_9176/g.32499 Transcript_9176/m.32499 type:complete len:93 (-) Transcript_9176:260-538(-)